jgi:hypothetical protein
VIFDPNDSNATLVHTSEGQSPCKTDYASEYEAYLKDRDIAAIMRERSAVRM